jgi:hypothetical protein
MISWFASQKQVSYGLPLLGCANSVQQVAGFPFLPMRGSGWGSWIRFRFQFSVVGETGSVPHSRLNLLFVIRFPFVSRLPAHGDGQRVTWGVGGGQGVRCRKPEHRPSLSPLSQIEFLVLRFTRSDSSLPPSCYLVFTCSCVCVCWIWVPRCWLTADERTRPNLISYRFLCSVLLLLDDGGIHFRFVLAWHRSSRSLLRCAYAGINSVLGLSSPPAAWLVYSRFSTAFVSRVQERASPCWFAFWCKILFVLTWYCSCLPHAKPWLNHALILVSDQGSNEFIFSLQFTTNLWIWSYSVFPARWIYSHRLVFLLGDFLTCLLLLCN